MEAKAGGVQWRRGARRDAARWQALVTQQAASGLSVATFCAQEAVSLSSFRRWRRRLQGAGSALGAASAGFVDLGPLGVAAVDGRCEVTLDLGGGVVLRLVRG